MTKRLGTHDDTPLPQAVPHHIADPTERIEHLDLFLFDDDEPGDGAVPVEDDDDLSESLATRQIPRIDPEQLEKLMALEGVPAIDDDEAQTRPLPAVDDPRDKKR